MASKVALLDPSPINGIPLTWTHPACRYQREPWAGSTVRVFPASRNKLELARYALEIVKGRRRGGVPSAILRRAGQLHEAKVCKADAIAELVEYEAALERMVALAQERQHAS